MSRVCLSRSFFDRPTLDVTADLIGKVLVHQTRAGVAAGMIVEVEAYIGEDDPACHAAPGPTKRNEPLYGPPGVAYVYLNYGMHYLVNVVTEAKGAPAAVLIRALAPLDGIPLMMRRRLRQGFGAQGRLRQGFGAQGRANGKPFREAELCRGPGNLTKALGISLKENRLDLTASRLWVEDRGLDAGSLNWGTRIGINVGTERPWRCWAAGHECVSGRRSSRSREVAGINT
ncbi:MAG TPA: DNA-3-methyladenine glycosylase [Vicinamibacterales bacterium]